MSVPAGDDWQHLALLRVAEKHGLEGVVSKHPGMRPTVRAAAAGGARSRPAPGGRRTGIGGDCPKRQAGSRRQLLDRLHIGKFARRVGPDGIEVSAVLDPQKPHDFAVLRTYQCAHEADVLANFVLVARHPNLRNAQRGAPLWKRVVRAIIGSELLLAIQTFSICPACLPRPRRSSSSAKLILSLVE
jgi:hypothetical protein